MDERALVADIGGTHCRFALARRAPRRPLLEAVRVVPTPRGELAPAIRDYLDQAGCHQPAAIAVAAAGRVRRLPGRTWISLTNVQLDIERESLADLCSGRAWVTNDLAAVAAALPLLDPDELPAFGPAGSAVPGLRLVIGVGTGFGAAALTADGTVIETEAGHADLAAVSAEERQWLHRLAPHGRLPVETLLSGPGLLRLFEVISGQACHDVEVLLTHLRNHDPAALRTISGFSTWLGRATGNLVLSLGAWGGVYLTGGVLTGLGAALDVQAFRRGFEDKAPFAADLAAVPVQCVAHAQPALLGMARIAFDPA